MAKSLYFKKLLSETPEPQPEQTTFEDADETALAMFAAWVHGKQLHGPNDFHSTGHYLGLYVLALKFECEELANHGMFPSSDFVVTGWERLTNTPQSST